MSKFWSPDIHALKPYVPGEQLNQPDIIKLNTNENPYPPSGRVLQALESYDKDRLRLYPDPNCSALKQALARHHGVEPAQVFVGNGSDEVLALAFMTFFRQPHPLLMPDITYSFYPVYCQLFGITRQPIPLDEGFRVCLADYPEDNGGVILANPNAPTGIPLPLSEIRALLGRNTGSVVLVDEAYVDFGAESAVSLVKEFPNLLVVHTFSKSRSLAGLRVGYAIGSPELVDGLERVKNSFNSYPLDSLAMAAAIAAVEDNDYFEATRQRIIQTRNETVWQLESLGFEVLPSATNFIFARHPGAEAEQLYTQLKARRILVRHFGAERIRQWLRITIGRPEEMSALTQALRDLLRTL